jgi:NAD(P)-dependent dehydrogenase (short-subunit alcohol dehydrogenase family)
MDGSKRFSGKSVVVTGAANGMGKQITLDFLSEDATVVGVDVNEEALKNLKKEVADEFGEEYASRFITFVGDITKPQTSVDMIAKAIEATGEINVLVNNAGVAGRSEPVTETKDEDWHRIIDVDLNGPMYSIREAVSKMLEQKNGGNIVTIASVAGLRSGRSSVAYTVAKHGLVGLCEHTAWAYMHKGIRCNMVCPGIIKTSMSSTFDTESEFGRERILAGLDPDQEFGEPSDISRTVLFLASDESKYINGASFVVDGGSNCN